MSGKKIQIGAKPTVNKLAPANADAWVTSKSEPSDALAPAVMEKMKRLTIDISEKLHRDIKRECAVQGVAIADVARDLLHEWVQKQKET